MRRTFSCIAAALGLAAALTACAHDRAQDASGGSRAGGGSTIYPAGIVAPADFADAMHAGIYASDAPKTCCFLAGSALLTLDNPPGSQLAVFTFYVPSVAPLAEKCRTRAREFQRKAGRSAGGALAGNAGRHVRDSAAASRIPAFDRRAEHVGEVGAEEDRAQRGPARVERDARPDRLYLGRRFGSPPSTARSFSLSEEAAGCGATPPRVTPRCGARSRCGAHFRLPAAPEPVAFPSSEHPVVSIVIPAFDRWPYTNACLKALLAAHDPSIATEIVVVDDASTDRTAELLAACRGVRTVRLERNAGFAAACNAGAAAARGAYLHFLNNDALVTNGWEAPTSRDVCRRSTRRRGRVAVTRSSRTDLRSRRRDLERRAGFELRTRRLSARLALSQSA